LSYSFIKPRKKYLLEGDSKFWLLFIFTSIFIMIAFTFFLKMKTSELEEIANLAQKKELEAKESINNLNKKVEFINMQKEKANSIYSSNLLLRDSIKNLFDLVPDQITLDKVQMNKKELIINGSTPSKDIYNFLLLAQLKSIFTKNETTFYMLPNGWFKFVSVNKIESFDGVIE